MTIHLDTSALVDALTGPRRSLDVLIGLADAMARIDIGIPERVEAGPGLPEPLRCRVLSGGEFSGDTKRRRPRRAPIS